MATTTETESTPPSTTILPGRNRVNSSLIEFGIAPTFSDHSIRLIRVIGQDATVRKVLLAGGGLVAVAALKVVLKDPAVGEPVAKWLRDLAATTKSIGNVVDQLAAT
ncbi:hypothetical protein [Cryobacterium serini]|uniref:Uncharacterized protein n=1 Tax=Cryobacterium serini TaxID=1259201 RepID=A0A4R9BSV4_9MICO|nr:hypothetical protein [Cryobacterium serini]TFD89786.1 hypothetical protein E3T51_03445 [Cryobacterium serini]